jgi:Sec-independent protein translocase protein TatA
MRDLNEKIEERWRQRRKKGYNWPKLLILIAVLVAIIYGMGMLQRMGESAAEPMAEVRDTTMVETPEQTP